MELPAIRLKKRAASKGIKLDHHKVTAGSPIERMPLPEKVVISMQQNIGAPCAPLVKKGENVLTGQKIGDAQGFVKAPVHATVSGEVTETKKLINPPNGVLVDALVITSDGTDNRAETEPAKDLASLTKEEILTKIGEAGLVGLGGATFPTRVKLSPAPDIKIDAVIINACECESWVTSDHRIMLEFGEKVLSGITIMQKILAPEKTFIAIEDNKEDAIIHLEKLIRSTGRTGAINIVPLKSQYPMGGEKILTQVLLGKEVPIGGLPTAVGAVVQNVSTTKAIHDAVLENQAYIEKVVTVTGMVKQPKNLLVRIGTPISDLIEYCGGMADEANEVIMGGPMMGISQFDLGYPVTKGTNCILVTQNTSVREQNCIRCGKCVDVCPMNLIPTNYVKYVKAGHYTDCKDNYIEDCFECGSCSWVCPAHIPITQYIKVGKSELNKRKTKA
jgi:electron transport complex protein RnfC